MPYFFTWHHFDRVLFAGNGWNGQNVPEISLLKLQTISFICLGEEKVAAMTMKVITTKKTIT